MIRRSAPLKARSSRRLEPERPLATWCQVQLAGCDGRARHRHERKRRAQGGDGSPENTLDLCGYCHRWIHLHPSEAYAKGLLVEHWLDPAEVPVQVSPRLLAFLGFDDE